MEFVELELPGCYLIKPRIFEDGRGRFVKTLLASELTKRGLRSDFVEQFYSVSNADVIRGMHFQTPPHDHAKLVYCPQGAVLDVLVDLRTGSPTYRQHCSRLLSAEDGHLLYIPVGIAHGFQVTTAPSLMVYNVTSEHAPAHDAGIRWDSFGFAWSQPPVALSARDAAFPALADFDSPFRA